MKVKSDYCRALSGIRTLDVRDTDTSSSAAQKDVLMAKASGKSSWTSQVRPNLWFTPRSETKSMPNFFSWDSYHYLIYLRESDRNFFYLSRNGIALLLFKMQRNYEMLYFKMSHSNCISWDKLKIFLGCTWRNHFLKPKIKEPAKLLSSSGMTRE